jgi:transcriptional regulator with XRE-family HTH domain
LKISPGERLAHLRMAVGLSQTELARAARMHQADVSAIERGRRPLHGGWADRISVVIATALLGR